MPPVDAGDVVVQVQTLATDPRRTRWAFGIVLVSVAPAEPTPPVTAVVTVSDAHHRPDHARCEPCQHPGRKPTPS